MKKLIIATCVIPSLLTGCMPNRPVQTADNEIRADGMTSLGWSALPTSEQRAIMSVSTHFGEVAPKVTRILETTTDNTPHQVMYRVELSGHFNQGVLQSTDIEFSILGDGSKAWAFINKAGTFKDEELLLN